VSSELASRLDPAAIEPPIYRMWMEKGYFHVSPREVVDAGREPYVIVIPPPNVTAVLHMGHGLNNTIQDVLIRWRRMQGRASLWVPGTDHAGIATQNVVERRLAARGKTRDDLGREAFVEEVWSFVRDTGGTILEQLKSIGASCDWERTRFTLEPELSRAVREVFVRLHDKGLVYRGEYIINWCPRCLTALSNEEAEAEEVDGQLWHLRYPLAEDAWETAAAAHAAWTEERETRPGSGRRRWRGARRPGARAPGASEARRSLRPLRADPPAGWGLGAGGLHHPPRDHAGRHGRGGEPPRLPLCGAGGGLECSSPSRAAPSPSSPTTMWIPRVRHRDGEGHAGPRPNDFEMARRDGTIPILDVMTPDARMNDNVPEPFRGMDRFEARKAVVKAFEAAGLWRGWSRTPMPSPGATGARPWWSPGSRISGSCG
jgi:hypothetical protein